MVASSGILFLFHLAKMTEPFGFDDFVTGFRVFEGRVPIAESFISKFVDFARERARLAG